MRIPGGQPGVGTLLAEGVVEGMGDAQSPLTLSSTVAKFVAVQPDFNRVRLYSASQFKLLFGPALRVAVLLSGSTYTDYLATLTDKSDTTHMPLDGMTTAKRVMLGLAGIPGGVHINIGSHANAVAASALDVEHYTGSEWTNVAGDSDLTDSGGVTLAVDGLYSWTVPASGLATGAALGITGTMANLTESLYWIRFSPSKTLSDEVDILELIAASKRATYMLMEAGQEYEIPIDTEKAGGLQLLSVSATPSVDINWLRTGI